MAATVKFSPITLFCYLLALSHLKVTISKPGGFTLEILIHRDSPQSPLYPGNLTLLERFKRLVQVSDSHISHLHYLREFYSQNSTIFNPNIVRPKVIHEAKLYIIKLNIGSKPVTNYLVLDTDSDSFGHNAKETQNSSNKRVNSTTRKCRRPTGNFPVISAFIQAYAMH
jgi:hypothetical protein